MFLQACVILFTGGGHAWFPGGVCFPGGGRACFLGSMHASGGRGHVCFLGGVCASWGGVCFLGVCMLPRGCACFPGGVHTSGGGVCASGGCVCFPGGVHASRGCVSGGHACNTPPPSLIPRDTVGQWAGGTHPTGMHSCFIHTLDSRLVPTWRERLGVQLQRNSIMR